MLGYDRDWHDLDDINRRSVNYTNLPPGDYTFEVMAANNAGIWSPVIARYRFDIRRYFHETALFYGLAGLLLALLIYAGHRREQQVHAAQRALLEQQVRERTGQLHSANERLENASQTDPLTGLRNRRYLANQIPTDLAFYDREQLRSGNYDQSILFALVNIDHFKQINDKHGHKAGDRVLQQFAHTLSTLLRREDYVARWGGDEFLLVLRPMPTRHLHALGERVRAAIAMHAFDSGNDTPLHLTCSLGIADYPLFHDAQRRLGWEQVVELAEAALRWAKNNGRDCWVAFHPSAMVDVTTLMRELKVDPRKLIEDGQLQVFGSHIAVR